MLQLKAFVTSHSSIKIYALVLIVAALISIMLMIVLGRIISLEHKRPIGVGCFQQFFHVCLSECLVICVKTAEQIWMLFRLVDQFGPGICFLDGGANRPTRRGKFGGRYGAAHYNKWETCRCYVRTCEMIKLPFGMVSGVGPRNGMLDGGPDPPW